MERQKSRREVTKIIMGNPGVGSLTALKELLFGEKIPESVIIKNKNYREIMRIPGEAFQTILAIKVSTDRLRAMSELIDAIRDTTDLTINYKKD